jgi:hypothetical protein
MICKAGDAPQQHEAERRAPLEASGFIRGEQSRKCLLASPIADALAIDARKCLATR